MATSLIYGLGKRESHVFHNKLYNNSRDFNQSNQFLVNFSEYKGFKGSLAWPDHQEKKAVWPRKTNLKAPQKKYTA